MLHSTLTRLTASLLSQVTDEKTSASWTWDPRLHPVILLALFVAAALLAVYLYVAQQRIAARRVVVTLTTLRVLLILLIFLILLGPIRQFVHTGKTGGSLWIVADQSGSMGQSDPQATPVEKLRWADAAGLLPANFRTSALDRPAARLRALRQESFYLQAMAAAPVEEKDTRKRLDALVKELKRWNSQLLAATDSVEKGPQGSAGPAAGTLKALRGASETVSRGIEKTDARSKPEESAGDIPWKDVQAALKTAAETLSLAADKLDKTLAADPKAADALTKVSKMSRAQLALAELNQKSKRGAGGFDEVFPRQNVKVLGFGDRAQLVGTEKSDKPDAAKKLLETALAKPGAPATDLAGALRAVGDHLAQDEPASVVVVSDGRQNKNDSDLIENTRRLAARGVRVYTVALGTDRVAPDAAVESIDAPDWIFKDDSLRVSSMLTLDGLDGRPITVELRRGQMAGGRVTEDVVDTQSFTVDKRLLGENGQPRKIVTFNEPKDKRPGPGLYDYSVVIKDVPEEVNTKNNRQTTRVSVKEHPLTALVVEDQPRWEYRYMANYLQRDKRVKLQTVLLQPAQIAKVTPPSPVKASPDNPRVEAQLLPETQEEWFKFDLIVLGDLPPEALTRQNQQFISKAVTERGASLIIMAGPLNMPGGWGANKADYPLAELFPVEPNPEWTPQALQAHLRNGYHPAVAPEGVDSLLSQFGIDEETTAKAWSAIRTDPDLSWFWHSDVTQAKGGANVIWMIADNDRRGEERKPAGAAAGAAAGPGQGAAAGGLAGEAGGLEAAHKRALLATMNAGMGKVMYFAGDATWRLRQVNGQNLHERFWGQVIRWAVGNDLPAGGELVRFGSDKPRYVGGETAVVTVRAFDKHHSPLRGESFKIVARQLPQPAGTGQRTDAGGPTHATRAEAEATEAPESPGLYRATLGNLPSGLVELSLEGGQVQALLDGDATAAQKTLVVEVQNGLNLEQRNINADRQTLERVAEAGNGFSVDGPYADLLADQLPDLNYTLSTAEQIGLFTGPENRYSGIAHWSVLILFVGLITAEWIIRKLGGLV